MSLLPMYGPHVVGLTALLMALACLATVSPSAGQAADAAAPKAPPVAAPAKTFIDYFLPTPATGPLASDVWGATAVGPRDPENGLEDATMKKWDYWDGQIIRARDGKYHMFASRWDQAKGHNGWWSSQAVHAVSDKVTGPYIDKGLCWPDNEGGKGHNVTALVLPDGRYAVVVSETRPGDVFVSKSLDGPWEYLGRIQVAPNEFSGEGRMSNVSILARPDGGFQIVPRSGAILISKTGILGPYTVRGPSIYPSVPGLPQHDLHNLEDPMAWFSGGLYHIVVNNWSDRKAYHLTSLDGITGWTYRGLAYDPTTDFVRYANGTVNHWNKMERPGVVMEDGHVTALTLAVIDVPKEQENGSDAHGSKVIVIPFNGVALDRDLQHTSTSAASETPPTAHPIQPPPVVLGPDDRPAFPPAPAGYDRRREGVAHGRMETVAYASRTVGTTRHMLVYTPPGYSPGKKYPTLYLLHGIGGDETEWERNAAPEVILDNLYADGKIVPMIVVLPNSRATPNDRAEGNVYAHVAAFEVFEGDLLRDVIPFMETHYPVKTGPEDRALAGLSMGGGQSLDFGLGNLDTFAWVGGFSPAPNTHAPEVLVPDPAETARKLKMLWISCGDQDGLIFISQRLHAYLKAKNVPHVYHIDRGRHAFPVWKNDLYLFSQRLFQSAPSGSVSRPRDTPPLL